MMKRQIQLLFLLGLWSIRSFSMTLLLESPAFQSQSTIPVLYTCKGKDLSPPLIWNNPPANTKSFVLIVDDPDAPFGTWVHWVLFNIPAHLRQLAEATSTLKPAISGKNSWGTTGYRGPCPPSGTHHYMFTLYALDTELKLDDRATKQTVMDAMQDHVIESSVLIGLASHSK
jgi:Raf kinase inhibitor-like YbhB/YbcL family protein